MPLTGKSRADLGSNNPACVLAGAFMRAWSPPTPRHRELPTDRTGRRTAGRAPILIPMPSTEIQAGLSEHPEDEIVQSEIEGARRKKKSGKGRIIAIVVSVAVIGGVFAFALPKIANYGDVWDVVKDLSWEWIAALLLAVLLNTATYGPPWMAALPGLRYLHATRVTLASTAMSTVAPGGAAVGMATSFAMLRRGASAVGRWDWPSS